MLGLVARGKGRERKQRGAFIGGVPSLKDGPGPLLFFLLFSMLLSRSRHVPYALPCGGSDLDDAGDAAGGDSPLGAWNAINVVFVYRRRLTATLDRFIHVYIHTYIGCS